MQVTNDWLWEYDAAGKQLYVVIDDGIRHPVPYRSSQLINIHFSQQALDIDDASLFQKVLDDLQQFDELQGPHLLPAALNAMAWCRFGRPQMPQSWHFQQGELASWNSQRKLCELNSGFTQGLFYILDNDGEFSTVMLLSDSMTLSDIKTFQRFHVVKILNDRLLPATIELVQTTKADWNQRSA
ncbi:cell division protein [Idiomarina tyrosinivorans]|uniref:Cell division protein n=1 Tax=Idiomarina tyrosinivorans TaxID=1445662 RepID=A0A432ZTQ9_9GAMM|nr:cell division protein ZapC domain-containing protein [Idiomarina tyrosinivorans]RUO81297.1 cell division protein [Idiomarina tyrosinivorans]